MHTYRCWKKQLWSLQSGNSACISIKYPQKGEQARERERERERKKRKDTEEHRLGQKALDGLTQFSDAEIPTPWLPPVKNVDRSYWEGDI